MNLRTKTKIAFAFLAFIELVVVAILVFLVRWSADGDLPTDLAVRDIAIFGVITAALTTVMILVATSMSRTGRE